MVRWFGRPLAPNLLRRSDELSKYLRDELFPPVAVVYSKAGRRFPGKVWDDAYYDFLANSTMTPVRMERRFGPIAFSKLRCAALSRSCSRIARFMRGSAMDFSRMIHRPWIAPRMSLHTISGAAVNSSPFH